MQRSQSCHFDSGFQRRQRSPNKYLYRHPDDLNDKIVLRTRKKHEALDGSLNPSIKGLAQPVGNKPGKDLEMVSRMQDAVEITPLSCFASI